MRCLAPVQNRVGRAAHVKFYGADGIVVTGNNVVDTVRIVVRVDDAHHGNAQLHRLAYGDLLVSDVDDEHHIGQASHVLDTAKTALELRQLALHRQAFFLTDAIEAAGIDEGFQLLEPFDRFLDGTEIREHSAQPTAVHIGHAAALCFSRDHFFRRTLGSHKQYGAPVGGHAAQKIARVAVQRKRLLEIDDMNLVAFAEDERCHLRIPIARLVAEMNAGLQHLAHSHCGHITTPG